MSENDDDIEPGSSIMLSSAVTDEDASEWEVSSALVGNVREEIASRVKNPALREAIEKKVREAKEQDERLERYTDKCIDHALSTGSTDKRGFERGVREAYSEIARLELIKLDQNRNARGSTAAMSRHWRDSRKLRFAWFRSPLEGVVNAAMFVMDGEANLTTAVRGAMSDCIGSTASMLSTNKSYHKISFRTSPVVNAVVAELSLRALAVKHARATISGLAAEGMSGSLDMPDLSMINYLARESRSVNCDRLIGIVQSGLAGFWWPLSSVVVATELPTRLRFDSEGLVHCADGPAIEYADGFSVYCWHGKWISEDMLDAEALEWDDVEVAKDEELKRAAADVKARSWSEAETPPSPSEGEDAATAEERYAATLAAERLGGIGAIRKLTEENE